MTFLVSALTRALADIACKDNRFTFVVPVLKKTAETLSPVKGSLTSAHTDVLQVTARRS